MKGVFEISGSSRYDDLVAERYHFPRIYLRAAEACVGDWIVYRETGTAGGRKAYVAAARVESIDADSRSAGMFYARMRDFLELDAPVPYRAPDGRFAERLLLELDDPAGAGRALRGHSVRQLDGSDFAAIVNAGLSDTLSEGPVKLTRIWFVRSSQGRLRPDSHFKLEGHSWFKVRPKRVRCSSHDRANKADFQLPRRFDSAGARHAAPLP